MRAARITEILSLITLQQGPGEVVLAAKVRIAGALAGDEVARAINQFEQAVHDRCPEVRWLFVEPDIEALRERPLRSIRWSCSVAIGRHSSSTITDGGLSATVSSSRSRCSAHSRRRVARAIASSCVTTFISVSCRSECALRLAEPTVSQRSSTMPILAWT